MEKLRLKITLERDTLVLPLAHKHVLQGVIYNMLPKEKEGKFYHDQGYQIGDKKYKMFTFSSLFGHYTIDRQQKMIIFDGRLQFYISALDENFLQMIYHNLEMNRFLSIYGQNVQVAGVDIEELKYFKGERDLIIQTLSPVTAYITEGNYTTYYKPNDELFEILVINNLKHKCEAYHYPIEQIQFHIKNVYYQKKTMDKFKNCFYEAYLTKMEVHTNYDTLALIYNTGLSNKNSCGFGMINVKNEKNSLSV